MSVVDYTTYSDVRAVLGVSAKEISDNTLALEIYDNQLEIELNSLGDNLVTDYTTQVANLARTPDEEKFYKATRVFATYVIAKQLSSSLPLFSPKDISDGKAIVSRYADSPYKVTIERISAEYDRFKKNLESAYATVNSSSVTTTLRSYFVTSIPVYDPITG